MKILIWADMFTPSIGGIENRLSYIAGELINRGHEILLITDQFHHDLPSHEYIQGINIFRIPVRTTLRENNISKFKAIIDDATEIQNKFSPDIELIFISGGMFIIQKLVRRKLSVPVVASIQMDISDLKSDRALQVYLINCAKIIAVSQFVASSIAERNPALKSKTSILHNCLPRPDILPSPLPFDPPVLMCVGRMISEKGFDVAIRAFARLSIKHSQLRLIIVGDGPERVDLEALAHELKISDRVEFCGWISPHNITKAMNLATVVITPSRWQEAFGLVSLQAQQMGRPVIATRVGGTPEVVEDGQTGILFDNEDVFGLATSIETALENRSLLESMGRLAYERASIQFDFKNYIDQYEKLLHDTKLV